jgi:WD40 repeat protein
MEYAHNVLHPHIRMRTFCVLYLPSRRPICASCGCALLSCTHGLAQVVIGTKSGEMELFDLSSSTLVETIKAHTATLWSIHIRPDQQALVTGSADKDVKFWNFEWKQPDGGSVSTLFYNVLLLTMHGPRIRTGRSCPWYTPAPLR